jgi:hypothetical protein
MTVFADLASRRRGLLGSLDGHEMAVCPRVTEDGMVKWGASAAARMRHLAAALLGARVGWVRRSRKPTNWRTNVGLRDKAANPTYGLHPSAFWKIRWNLLALAVGDSTMLVLPTISADSTDFLEKIRRVLGSQGVYRLRIPRYGCCSLQE